MLSIRLEIVLIYFEPFFEFLDLFFGITSGGGIHILGRAWK
jgi:hypothetical protein